MSLVVMEKVGLTAVITTFTTLKQINGIWHHLYLGAPIMSQLFH